MAGINKLSLLVRNLSTTSAVSQMVKPPLQVFGLEGRYACALYSAASKQKSLEAVEKDLTALQKTMKTDVHLRDTLINPTINRTSKAKAFKESAKVIGWSPATGNLLELLAENGRLNKLDTIINHYKLIMSAHRGEVVCEVTTAKPLDNAQRKDLENALKKFLKANETIQLSAKVDPTIIGGMIVSIGDKYVDMSVATKVKRYTNLISLPA